MGRMSDCLNGSIIRHCNTRRRVICLMKNEKSNGQKLLASRRQSVDYNLFCKLMPQEYMYYM